MELTRRNFAAKVAAGGLGAAAVTDALNEFERAVCDSLRSQAWHRPVCTGVTCYGPEIVIFNFRSSQRGLGTRTQIVVRRRPGDDWIPVDFDKLSQALGYRIVGKETPSVRVIGRSPKWEVPVV